MKEKTMEEIRKKTYRNLLMIALVAVILLAADLIMSFQGSQVSITESEGKLYMIRPDAGSDLGHITLRAKVTGEGEEFEKKINVSLEPYGEKSEEEEQQEQPSAMTERERLEYEMRSVVSSFNDDSTLKKVLLPQTLEDGETISWQVERENNGLLIIISAVLLMAVVYKNRFAAIDKERKAQQESILRQLPEFVNRLVLLLNAGLVLNSAFERAIKESIAFKGSDDYFYSNMKELYLSVKTANSPLHRGFREFAKKSGSKELMRISNIINDNISKGVALTEKLQRESEILWLNRKKSCEERGRLAETKMTLPLMIFLMVLIVITVAPTLLEL
ncbi:MAG: type II secretion system F family protein [Bacillota bacterium]|nr:type II secretion system F family protein [Bacillota bacterium]